MPNTMKKSRSVYEQRLLQLIKTSDNAHIIHELLYNIIILSFHHVANGRLFTRSRL